jgi:hypothetical protein
LTVSGLFSSGHIVDLILVFMVCEFVVLRLRRHASARLVVALLPGVCLLLALRAALTGAGWLWVAIFLAASLPAHLFDLLQRRR